MTAPLVYVVVLSWNGKDDTLACLSSLQPVLDAHTRCLLVDNGSDDRTCEAVESRFPSVEILQNGENLGFAAGNNVGIRRALSRGADFVVLLNNDTTVDPGFVRELLAAALAHPEAGLFSSKIYFRERPDVLWFAGAKLNPATGRSIHVGSGEKDEGQHDRVREIDRPCGCALMASRRFLDEVGLMDERFFLYGEELDWALRARARGFTCLFVPGSRIWHRVSGGTGGVRTAVSHYYSVRNTLFALDQHAPLPLALRWARAVLVVLRFTASLFTMGVDKRKGLASVALGARDYLAGRMGRKP